MLINIIKIGLANVSEGRPVEVLGKVCVIIGRLVVVSMVIELSLY